MFFFFKINPASVGDFDFGRIPREWSDEIVKFVFFEANSALRSLLASLTFLYLFIEAFGSAPMTPELRGQIATLRRGNP